MTQQQQEQEDELFSHLTAGDILIEDDSTQRVMILVSTLGLGVCIQD